LDLDNQKADEHDRSTIRYDAINFTFGQKLTDSEHNLPHEVKQKINEKTN